MWPSTAYGRRAQASRRNEREPLARSGPQVASSGATDEATSATAGATATNPAGLTGVTPRNTTGGSRVSRSPEFRSPLRGGGGGGGSGGSSSNSNSSPWPLPRPSSARGSQYAEGAVQRGRAVTSARPSDDLAWPSLSPFIALERRSSLGYEGLPEMPLGRGVNLEAGELEEEPEQWKVRRGRSSNTADDTRGGLEHAQAPSAKRKSIRWVAEVDKEDALLRAVTFLEDALGYRDPDYYNDAGSISSYRLRQSRAWQTCTVVAVLAYIAACFLGKPPFSADWNGMPTPTAIQDIMGQTWGLCLELGCVLFFACDIYLLYRTTGARSIVTCWWKAAFVSSLFFSVADLTTRWYTHRPWSRVFRPAVFFFVGPKVRDCSISTLHAVGALMPVLVLELLVTLAYACVCVVLYHGVSEAPFTTLGDAFLSLFMLSTTVNDPDVWMPLYHRNRANVLVFSSFLVVQVFLLHNILLASVWNEFGERMKIYARKKRKWREESVRRAFEALDFDGAGNLPRDVVMTLLRKIRPHYDGSKRHMMYERIVQSVGRGRNGKFYDAAEVTQVHRREFCLNVVEALSLKIRTMRERKIARAGQYMLLPLYVWNMAFVVVSCAISPWVFNTTLFWLALLPTSVLLGASVLAELVMTGVRAYLVLPWNRVKTLSLVLTVTGLFWFLVFTAPSEWGSVVTQGKKTGKIRSVHMQVSIALLMSARCMDLGTLLRLVPAIHDVVSIMYMITPSVFAQAGVIFTIFHLYAYLGMALYGGVVTPGADFGDTPFANSPYYYDNNFNSYPEGLVTLFEMLVVNNWNMIITGYTHASPLGMWAYLYFLSFITLAVALALNVLTAIFMTAFTATTKANIPAVRGGGSLGQSMTSNSARTALGAGASLALRPSRGSYVTNSMSETEGTGDFQSPPQGGRERSSDNIKDLEILNARTGGDHAAGALQRASKFGQGGGVGGSVAGAGGEGGGAAATRKRISEASLVPSAGDLAQTSRFPDPLRSRLSATAVLPEHEAVEKVGHERTFPDMRDSREDSYLGWGAGESMPPPPPPPLPGAAGGGRTRWGSGHYYKVSRRNSYSDKDMFEAGIMAGDEDDVAGTVLSAISLGLGNSVGIRACMLRHKETRSLRRKNASPRIGGEPGSGGEDEPNYPDTQIMFENNVFRQMVAPHLREVKGGGRLAERDDDGWEAMAMRDELTDVMLHKAFTEAILTECPPPAQSPQMTSKSGFSTTASTAKSPAERSLSPTERGRPLRASSTDEDDMDEGDDYDLPKDLGSRRWGEDLNMEERVEGTGYKSKAAVLSIQCVLAVRKPVPVVVYTAKLLQ